METDEGRSSRPGKKPEVAIITVATLAASTGNTNPSVNATNVHIQTMRNMKRNFISVEVLCPEFISF